MLKHKQCLAFLLSAVMLFGLAGCGNEKKDGEDPEKKAQASGFVEKKVEPVSFDSGVELKDDCYHFIYALGIVG